MSFCARRGPRVAFPWLAMPARHGSGCHSGTCDRPRRAFTGRVARDRTEREVVGDRCDLAAGCRERGWNQRERPRDDRHDGAQAGGARGDYGAGFRLGKRQRDPLPSVLAETAGCAADRRGARARLGCRVLFIRRVLEASRVAGRSARPSTDAAAGARARRRRGRSGVSDHHARVHLSRPARTGHERPPPSQRPPAVRSLDRLAPASLPRSSSYPSWRA